mgnify:CR=1 FL=1
MTAHRCRLDLRVPDISSNKKDGAVNDHGAPHNDPVTDPVPACIGGLRGAPAEDACIIGAHTRMGRGVWVPRKRGKKEEKELTEKESQGKNKRHRGLEENVWPHTCYKGGRTHEQGTIPPPKNNNNNNNKRAQGQVKRGIFPSLPHPGMLCGAEDKRTDEHTDTWTPL